MSRARFFAQLGRLAGAAGRSAAVAEPAAAAASTSATSSTAVARGLAGAGFAGFAGFAALASVPFAVASCQSGGDSTTVGGVKVTTGNGASVQPACEVVFVLGGPGSGKGTQCEKLVNEFGLAHFSAGDLLRAHVKSGTPEGNMVADMIKNGQIVPAEVTVGLLKDAMIASGAKTVLIDGFPRNDSNRECFKKVTGIDCKFVLFFDCPEHVMEKRLLGRNQGRSDDNIETIRKRFKVFVEQSMPVVDHYEQFGKVVKVNSDQPPEAVYAQVKKLFE